MGQLNIFANQAFLFLKSVNQIINQMGNLLSKADLLQKEKLEVVKVEFDNGDYVYVRQMTGHERDMFEQSMLRKNRDGKGTVISVETVMDDFRSKLAAITLCDEDGKSLLDAQDYKVLSNSMSAKRLEKIINVSQKLNAITEEDKEEIVKNSKPEGEDNSNFASVEN
jgi:hypothetical protein